MAPTKNLLSNTNTVISIIIGILIIGGSIISTISTRAHNEATVQYMQKNYKAKFAEQDNQIKRLNDIVVNSKVDVIATKVDNIENRMNELIESDKEKTKLLISIMRNMPR